MKKKLSKKDISQIIEKLMETHPEAKAELNYTNPFELLIATMLSAQCTDVRVNKTTPVLFKKLSKASDIYSLKHEELEKIIKPCGLYKTKAKNIRKTCEVLNESYNGRVPENRDELIKLAGVGRKTANVVVSNAFGVPAIAVDTHVKRVSNRLGLANSDNVEIIEKELMKRIPKHLWTIMHHTIIFHGRRICKAQRPICKDCPVSDLCLHSNS